MPGGVAAHRPVLDAERRRTEPRDGEPGDVANGNDIVHRSGSRHRMQFGVAQDAVRQLEPVTLEPLDIRHRPDRLDDHVRAESGCRRPVPRHRRRVRRCARAGTHTLLLMPAAQLITHQPADRDLEWGLEGLDDGHHAAQLDAAAATSQPMNRHRSPSRELRERAPTEASERRPPSGPCRKARPAEGSSSGPRSRSRGRRTQGPRRRPGSPAGPEIDGLDPAAAATRRRRSTGAAGSSRRPGDPVRSASLVSGGRLYGGCGSAPMTVIGRDHPAARNCSTVRSAARPAPATRIRVTR